jgi:hypothetical protein
MEEPTRCGQQAAGVLATGFFHAAARFQIIEGSPREAAARRAADCAVDVKQRRSAGKRQSPVMPGGTVVLGACRSR